VFRSNIGNAKLGGLENDLGMSHFEYQWSLSIFFVGYILFQVPSNLIMRRWRPSLWLSFLMVSWGTVATCMAACKNAVGLMICRLLLGCFEAAFGGLIAYAISQIPTHALATWQWLFIIEGSPSILIALFAAWYLPDDPERAKFLTAEERRLEIERLAQDAGNSKDRSFSWAQVISVYKDWKLYVYSFIYLMGATALHGVTLFLPSIIAGMGEWSDAQAQALTTPPYVLAFVTTIAIGRSSDRFFDRAYHMVACNIVGILGFLLLILVPQSNVAAHYAASCLIVAAVYSNTPPKVAWFTNNFSGLTRRAIASATIVSVGLVGGIFSGQVYFDPPGYQNGNTIVCCCVIAQTLAVLGLRFGLACENKRRNKLSAVEKELEVQKYGGGELVGDRHPDFRYVL
ncbi:major facilitator superfamily domain-containing protein, partial [Fennellomyces sp. T-0311]